MTKFLYLILDVVFFTPLLAVLYMRFRRLLLKKRKFLLVSGFLGILLFFIVDPIAIYWGAWGYDYEKTLGVKLSYGVLEEMVFGILATMTVAAAICILEDTYQKGKSLRETFLKT